MLDLYKWWQRWDKVLSDNNTAEPRGAEGDLIGDRDQEETFAALPGAGGDLIGERDQKETFAARPPEVCG